MWTKTKSMRTREDAKKNWDKWNILELVYGIASLQTYTLSLINVRREDIETDSVYLKTLSSNLLFKRGGRNNRTVLTETEKHVKKHIKYLNTKYSLYALSYILSIYPIFEACSQISGMSKSIAVA